MSMYTVRLSVLCQSFNIDMQAFVVDLGCAYLWSTEVARTQSCANHMQHIECLSLATYLVPHGTKGQGLYAPQGSTTLLPNLSVTSKVSARTSCAWVGSRVRFRSSEDVTLLEFTSPVDREYMRRCQKFH